MASEISVLVTGFEPFGDHSENISEKVAEMVNGQRKISCPWTGEEIDVNVETTKLTVDAQGAQHTAQRVRQGARWDAILHVGLCERCETPRVEQLARDRLDMRIPDNAGRQINATPLDGYGHRGCWIDVSIWDEAHFPTPYSLSLDAGGYLCNETYHATMKALMEATTSRPIPPPVLFLHLPDEGVVSLQEAVEFVEACLGYMLRPYPRKPTHVVAGCLQNAQGQVLVAQRRRGHNDADLWEFPGGKCEVLESTNEAIERELREELAIVHIPTHVLGTWYRETVDAAYAVHLIGAQPTEAVGEMRLVDHQAVRWLTLKNNPSLNWAGRDGEMFSFLGEVLKPKS